MWRAVAAPMPSTDSSSAAEAERISGSEPKRCDQALDQRLGERLGQAVQQAVAVGSELRVQLVVRGGRLRAATTLGRSIRASGESERRCAMPFSSV